ncbi:hypothetical protein O3G_MSEX004000 [Manduca sexta]|uniref:Uncharacterized protein n=1 Tax=Manduca sexta TaxID=7130 RepID=A0A921YVZ8_MANSE|nr:hypothetical protein O3G_MSEX004000 [Manduca sexta]
MSTNKLHGLSLSAINLENSCYSHSQLYVACSRVGKQSILFIYALKSKTQCCVSKSITINTVFIFIISSSSY